MKRTLSPETHDCEWEDDEHATYLQRPQPQGRERVVEMARNARHLGRRSLVALRLRLQNAARRQTKNEST